MPAYDPTQHRQSIRRPRERGVSIFIPESELRAAGIDPDALPPAYRVWGRRSGSVMVRLYGSRTAELEPPAELELDEV